MLALTIGALTYAGPAMAPARPALRAVSPVMDSDRGNYGYTNDVSKPGEFFSFRCSRAAAGCLPSPPVLRVPDMQRVAACAAHRTCSSTRSPMVRTPRARTRPKARLA